MAPPDLTAQSIAYFFTFFGSQSFFFFAETKPHSLQR